jgi:hypothetical protein
VFHDIEKTKINIIAENERKGKNMIQVALERKRFWRRTQKCM